ncbi:MAG: inositol monophosphatase [Leptospira sp.]|nr:inositol monophosphatase [Leptospira sp.]
MSSILSPNLEFPIDETHRRVAYIKSKISQISEAAIKLQKDLRTGRAITDSEEKERMLKSDLAIEDILIKNIQKNFPEDLILSEEAGHLPGTGNFRWVIDPVDGSMNFVRGLPLYAISIGIEYRESSVAGIVVLPAFNDVYIAILGEGASKNGVPISVSLTDKLSNAMLITSFPTNRKEVIGELMSELSAFVASGRSIRRTGSVVLDMCWVSEGLIDGLWEKGIKIWDTSATSVILHEAGGKLTDLNGVAFLSGQSEILASNGHLHKQVLEVLQKIKKGYSLN